VVGQVPDGSVSSAGSAAHTRAGDRSQTMVLTGASRGIGHAIAKRFTSAGWRVVTVSRSPFPASCVFAPGWADHIQADLSDATSFPAVITALRSRLDGRLDGLVNNAGISPKDERGERLGVLTTPSEMWQEVLAVNLVAAAALIQGLFAELAAARGAVVNVTSIAGIRVHPFAGSAYACSKAALTALTREASSELGPHGIRVNAVSPGEIDTAILSSGTDRLVEERVPMGRLGTPDDVADATFFLCSPQAGYLSGVELPVDGAERAS
jgi:NAD(P)-dependent dehydrogenase (short-subunit alcohol dehydrogenase family)